MISVPVSTTTVISTVQQLPRLPREAGLVPVQLKRKKEYERCHKKELVDPEKVIRTLQTLKTSGHPYYQFSIDLDSYQRRCEEQDQEGHKLLFGSDDSENEMASEDSDDDGEKEANDGNKAKDTIKKYQFDHNRNTCLTNNFPEACVDVNGKEVTSHEELIFAPAEGNYPTNILDEKDWDIKSWPILHPDGR